MLRLTRAEDSEISYVELGCGVTKSNSLVRFNFSSVRDKCALVDFIRPYINYTFCPAGEYRLANPRKSSAMSKTLLE